MTPWQALGVDQEVAVTDLRRRYAALIKEFRPETHPQDFARIRAAYEVALPFARRREQERAEETGEAGWADTPSAETGTEAPPTAGEPAAGAEVAAMPGPQVAIEVPPAPVAGVPPVATDAAAAPTVAAAPVADRGAPDDEPPRLATHFQHFHALAGAATGTDDESWLPALRDLLQARVQATLDDSQALEFALLRWFIESDAPPLTLLFETGRAFDWHRHPARLSGWLSPWVLRQMEARLALSRDLVYARHFSGNACLRRLHSPRRRIVPIVFHPTALEALHWARRWQHGCEDADAKPLAACLDPRALKRLQGLASTDLLVGACAGLPLASVAPDLAGVLDGLLFGLVATAIVFGSRRVLQFIAGLAPTHWARRIVRGVAGSLAVAGVLAAVAAFVGAVVLAAPEPGSAAIALGAVLIAPATLFAAALAWRVAAWLELVAAWPFLWREAVHRLEFDRFLDRRGAPPAGRAFGPRMGFLPRLRSVPEALRLQEREVLRHERPPRARPFRLVHLGGTKSTPKGWRYLWFALWAAFAIARLVHAVGGAP